MGIRQLKLLRVFMRGLRRILIATIVISFVIVILPIIFPRYSTEISIFTEVLKLSMIFYVLLNVTSIGRKIPQSTFCEMEEDVYEAAIQLTKEADEVRVLGPLQTVMILHGDKDYPTSIIETKRKYLETIKKRISEGMPYARVINFVPNWDNEESIKLLAKNAVFFKDVFSMIRAQQRVLKEEKKAPLEILHCKTLFNIAGDFHFNTSKKETLIILGEYSKKKLNRAILIRDREVASSFTDYFDDTIRPESVELDEEKLSKIAEYLEKRDRITLEKLLHV